MPEECSTFSFEDIADWLQDHSTFLVKHQTMLQDRHRKKKDAYELTNVWEKLNLKWKEPPLDVQPTYGLLKNMEFHSQRQPCSIWTISSNGMRGKMNSAGWVKAWSSTPTRPTTRWRCGVWIKLPSLRSVFSRYFMCWYKRKSTFFKIEISMEENASSDPSRYLTGDAKPQRWWNHVFFFLTWPTPVCVNF